MFLTDPLNATLAFGNVTGSVQATLPALTRPVSIGVAIPGNLSTDTLYRFEKIFASNYLQINGVAYTISVKKVNLANAPANITFTIPASWVDQRGGNEAVRITRISDETGMPEMINTTYEGLDAQGNMIFCGDSPGGMSLFGLLTLIHPFAVNAHHHFFCVPFLTSTLCSLPGPPQNVQGFGKNMPFGKERVMISGNFNRPLPGEI